MTVKSHSLLRTQNTPTGGLFSQALTGYTLQNNVVKMHNVVLKWAMSKESSEYQCSQW